jgi:hypothetical protein
MTCCGSRRLCSPPQCAIRSSRAAVFQIRPELLELCAPLRWPLESARADLEWSAIRSRSAPKFS